MNIEEYATNCELYSYSREYFDICRKHEEKHILDIMIENTNYINNLTSTISPDTLITESYLFESLGKKDKHIIQQKSNDITNDFNDTFIKNLKSFITEIYKLTDAILRAESSIHGEFKLQKADDKKMIKFINNVKLNANCVIENIDKPVYDDSVKIENDKVIRAHSLIRQHGSLDNYSGIITSEIIEYMNICERILMSGAPPDDLVEFHKSLSEPKRIPIEKIMVDNSLMVKIESFKDILTTMNHNKINIDKVTIKQCMDIHGMTASMLSNNKLITNMRKSVAAD